MGSACLVPVVLGLVLGIVPRLAFAATINVACGDVAGLKAAIISAAPGDTVLLANGCRYTLTVVDNNDGGFGANGLPLINKTLAIGGDNATITRSSGSFRFFDVAAGGSLTVDHLTISNASTPLNGGAVLVKAGGALAAFGSTFLSNTATGGGGVFNATGANLTVADDTFTTNSAGNGGGIFNAGTAAISRTTFHGNGSNSGGAVTNAAGTISVVNSTFFGNVATSGAGAFDNVATATVRSSTFSGNSSPSGFGAISPTGPGNLTLQDSIVANASRNCGPVGPLTDGGHNLSWPDSTCPGSHVDPRLGSLSSNGGPTQTLALLPGSPAIDAIPPVGAGCPATDQRGISRPQGPACDIGAFELTTSTPTPTAAPVPAPPSTGNQPVGNVGWLLPILVVGGILSGLLLLEITLRRRWSPLDLLKLDLGAPEVVEDASAITEQHRNDVEPELVQEPRHR